MTATWWHAIFMLVLEPRHYVLISKADTSDDGQHWTLAVSSTTSADWRLISYVNKLDDLSPMRDEGIDMLMTAPPYP
jgi:hypothetical protein